MKLAVVVSSIAILLILAVWVSTWKVHGRRYQQQLAQVQLDSIATIVDDFHVRHGRFPASSEVDSLAYRHILIDPWRRPIVYRLTDGPAPVYYSAGPDGQDDGGGNDDVEPSTPE